jgi:hypothetical protein
MLVQVSDHPPWPEPVAGEYEAWVEMCALSRPLWERVPERAMLRTVCEAMYEAFRDYYAGRRGPPTVH